MRVQALVLYESAIPILADLFARLGVPDLPIRALTLPSRLAALTAATGRFEAMKLPKLMFWQRMLRRFDAIVTAERTTTVLRRLPGRQPLLIHIPHGAGDRARGFERRLKLFDFIITAGEKDRRRMIAERLARPENCKSSGYVKLAAVRRLSPEPDIEPLDPARPTLFYNPHFEPEFSSWSRFGEALVGRIIADGRYNLIVAPHVRLQETLSPEDVAAWEAKAVPGQMIVDFGSWRSFDMSYTRSADVYIGDVSSQVYEFLVTPKPCLFLDAHAATWRDNPDFAMWAFGPVCRSVDEAMAELERAPARHAEFIDIQRAGIADAFGTSGDDAPDVAAGLILDRLTAFRAARPMRSPPRGWRKKLRQRGESGGAAAP